MAFLWSLKHVSRSFPHSHLEKDKYLSSCFLVNLKLPPTVFVSLVGITVLPFTNICCPFLRDLTFSWITEWQSWPCGLLWPMKYELNCLVSLQSNICKSHFSLFSHKIPDRGIYLSRLCGEHAVEQRYSQPKMDMWCERDTKSGGHKSWIFWGRMLAKHNLSLTDRPSLSAFPKGYLKGMQRKRIRWRMFYRLEVGRRDSSQVKGYVLTVPRLER